MHNLFSQVLVIGTVTGRLCLHCPFSIHIINSFWLFCSVFFCFVFFLSLFCFSRGHNWDSIPASHHKRKRIRPTWRAQCKSILVPSAENSLLYLINKSKMFQTSPRPCSFAITSKRTVCQALRSCSTYRVSVNSAIMHSSVVVQ